MFLLKLLLSWVWNRSRTSELEQLPWVPGLVHMVLFQMKLFSISSRLVRYIQEFQEHAVCGSNTELQHSVWSWNFKKLYHVGDRSSDGRVMPVV
jgi:hypothetical protein